jgi:hypothetical protein
VVENLVFWVVRREVLGCQLMMIREDDCIP